MLNDGERLGKSAPLPVESLPGWRGAVAAIVVMIEASVISISGAQSWLALNIRPLSFSLSTVIRRLCS